MTKLTTEEFVAYRKETGGCLELEAIEYTLKCEKSGNVFKGTLVVTDKHREQVRKKLYGSTFFAAIDSVNWRSAIKDMTPLAGPELDKLTGAFVVAQHDLPTWKVLGVSEDGKTGYVTGTLCKAG